MVSASDTQLIKDCDRIKSLVFFYNFFNSNDEESVSEICNIVYDSEVKGKIYSGPMLWIGFYVAVASLFCILLMTADLVHAFRNRKLWFPSKYFTLNTASITIIAIAMKLTVDMTSPMPGYMDKLAKLGSMTFMCTMMANLMPSLASMDNKELFTNVAGMVILVVTMVVNILIQINTGVIDDTYVMGNSSVYINLYINVGAMLFLLVVLISSALAIPTSKRILEAKYQAVHKTISNDVHAQHTVEELTQRVRKYWVMAGTCSPQFVMITTPPCSAAGIICVITTIMHYFIILERFIIHHERDRFGYESGYKWSMLVIYITQSIGIAVGTVASLFRCFAVLNFKLSIKRIKEHIKHIKVCEVEKYWTQMLMEWKKIHISFPLGVHISKALVYIWYNLILNFCIRCQKVIVVSCKIVMLIPLATVIIGMFCVYCWKSLKAKFIATGVSSNHETIHVVEQNDTNEDIRNYALQLQDEVELGIRILESISNSVNRSIRKAEKQQPTNLLKLIEQFTGFEGVVNFDSDNIQPLILSSSRLKFPNSWSLPVVTLTCIALTLPNISQESVDSLFNNVCEGLSYTILVEKSLNNAGEYVKIHKATTTLWREVEVSYRWLGNKLQRNAYKDKTTKQILEWFANKAKETVVELRKHNEEQLDHFRDKLIVADSMYRVTQTIKVNYSNDIEQNREEQVFGLLSSMIVDIMVACFTNLPRVIGMKCHDDAIEKREASVLSAAKLLGSTKKIIEKLQLCKVPTLDPDQRAFIDEWRVHLKQSIP